MMPRSITLLQKAGHEVHDRSTMEVTVKRHDAIWIDVFLGRCGFTGGDTSGLPCLRIRSVGLCPSSNLHRAGFMPGDVRFLSSKVHRRGGCASRSGLPFDGGSTGL